MDAAVLIEIYGYIGSALVVISMLMSSVVKLRVINVAGSIISGTYALIIGSYPLVIMNACLITINVYNLFKLLKTEQEYDLVEGKPEDSLLAYFLEHYKEDIQIYFPEFRAEDFNGNAVYIVCCNADPAGVMLGTDNGSGEVDIMLDYSIPLYRDCSVGKYLHSELAKKGIHKLSITGASEKHIPYLKKMGYVKENDCYVKKQG